MLNTVAHASYFMTSMQAWAVMQAAQGELVYSVLQPLPTLARDS